MSFESWFRSVWNKTLAKPTFIPKEPQGVAYIVRRYRKTLCSGFLLLYSMATVGVVADIFPNLLSESTMLILTSVLGFSGILFHGAAGYFILTDNVTKKAYVLAWILPFALFLLYPFVLHSILS